MITLSFELVRQQRCWGMKLPSGSSERPLSERPQRPLPLLASLAGDLQLEPDGPGGWFVPMVACILADDNPPLPSLPLGITNRLVPNDGLPSPCSAPNQLIRPINRCDLPALAATGNEVFSTSRPPLPGFRRKLSSPGLAHQMNDLCQARCHKRRKEGGRKERIIDCDRIGYGD